MVALGAAGSVQSPGSVTVAGVALTFLLPPAQSALTFSVMVPVAVPGTVVAPVLVESGWTRGGNEVPTAMSPALRPATGGDAVTVTWSRVIVRLEPVVVSELETVQVMTCWPETHSTVPET